MSSVELISQIRPNGVASSTEQKKEKSPYFQTASCLNSEGDSLNVQMKSKKALILMAFFCDFALRTNEK